MTMGSRPASSRSAAAPPSRTSLTRSSAAAVRQQQLDHRDLAQPDADHRRQRRSALSELVQPVDTAAARPLPVTSSATTRSQPPVRGRRVDGGRLLWNGDTPRLDATISGNTITLDNDGGTAASTASWWRAPRCWTTTSRAPGSPASTWDTTSGALLRTARQRLADHRQRRQRPDRTGEPLRRLGRADLARS